MPARLLARIVLALAAAAAVAAIAVLSPAPAPAGAQAGERLNVVVLMTDDQTAAAMRAMPITRQLIGGEGVTFDNSFVSYALCCPSRATFLTGQYAHNHHVLRNVWPLGGYYRLHGDQTLPVWLEAAGYRTMMVGRYLNEYGRRDPTEIPPGWTDWHALVDPTTHHYYGFKVNENGTVRAFPDTPENYQTTVLTRKTVHLIHDAADDGKPFFIWTAYTAPHYGYGKSSKEPDDPPGMKTPVPAPRDRDKFAKEPLPTPPDFDERDMSDKPRTIRNLPRITPRKRAAIQENYQQELETLQAVDRGVASIVDALQATGQLDRTLIVFTSDNGYYHGEHRIAREKTRPYDPAIRVPLLVRGPGIPRGVRRSQFVSNQDLTSTVLDVAGAEAALPQDGMSLLPLIHRPHFVPARDLLIEGVTSVGQQRVDFAGIRSPNWFYAEYTNGDRELYDLRDDPYELTSRAGKKRYAAIQAELAQRVSALRTCSGASCLERSGGTTPR